MNITEFLEARIEEDEAEASKYQAYEQDISETAGWWEPARVLAECAAKRAIIEIAVDQIRLGKEAGTWLNWEGMATQNLGALAAVYHNHPDYDPSWALTDS